MTQVAVIGLGYVGLTTAACLASRGIQTVGIEIDRRKLELLQSGKQELFEPKLDEILKTVLKKQRLELSSSIQEIGEADFIFICVGTPSRGDGSINLSPVRRAASNVGRVLQRTPGYKIVVVKSTTIPGTTLSVLKPILERSSARKLGEFGLCYNPEFLREGDAVNDTFQPDRIVIGAADEDSGESLASFYAEFLDGKLPQVIRTTPSNAEMIKYASNAFLAMKVSFINQIANLCEVTPGCDVVTVAEAIGLDSRIGRLFLRAGLGYGGSCFSKDLSALRNFARSHGVETPLVDATIRVNANQALRVVDFLEEVLGKLKGKRVALLGLSFKPGTDDMRDAVSLRVVSELLDRDVKVAVHDPAAMKNAKKILHGVEYAPSAIECIRGADCAVIVTEWDEFRKLKPSTFITQMRTPFVIDGRRIYDPKLFASGRVHFRAVGSHPSDK